MKKYESIMRRVRYIEEKYGIRYAKTNGRLFCTLKVIYTIVGIYTLGINLLYILGMLMRYGGTEQFSSAVNSLITVSAGTVILIAGFVLLCTRLKFSGAVSSIVPIPFVLFTFAHALKDDLGYFGFKASFYWRHFAPLVIMFVLLVWMAAIVIRERNKTGMQYKKIISNLYTQYHVGINSEGDTAQISNEQWNDFLNNYDPRDYKKQFSADSKSETKDEKEPK